MFLSSYLIYKISLSVFSDFLEAPLLSGELDEPLLLEHSEFGQSIVLILYR